MSAPVSNSKLHWFAYPQDETPQRITDAKKRLNQIKPRTPPVIKQKVAQKKHDEQVAVLKQYIYSDKNLHSESPTMRHWFYHEQPKTPELIKEVRIKQGDERYNGWIREYKKPESQSIQNLTAQDQAMIKKIEQEIRTASPTKHFVYNHFQQANNDQQAAEEQSKVNENSMSNVHDHSAISQNLATLNEYADMSLPASEFDATPVYQMPGQMASLDSYAVADYPAAVQNRNEAYMVMALDFILQNCRQTLK
jgi:hypothetical protein